MPDKTSVIRPTDEQARLLARQLLQSARYVSLAVLDPETGWPSVSRVLVALDPSGVPFILVSTLAAHTRSLLADPRCSFMAGEPGKGDPLAHARITVMALAEKVAQDAPERPQLRDIFLGHHPKSALYIDFPDFSFMRIIPQRASLNGGFGRAFNLDAADLCAPVA
ncbi:HugZ family protein [Rhizobium helianthi]|uniref:HugZ family protein n=1 Tax=Rhizobium helianthi TaxID=1132695 RepID=A0ABW4M3Q8_9HYPH